MTIIESKRNQLSNVNNPYQGNQPRVLCLCSAGLLRSATIADILVKTGKYNVRNAGCSAEYALIPLSTALLHWADKIVVVEEWYNFVTEALSAYGIEGVDVTSLPLEDIYCRNDPILVQEIFQGLLDAGWKL
jgi:predicted protein tyrosine phosphatase